MSDTSFEEYEIRCEENALEIVKGMQHLRSAKVEDSHAAEYDTRAREFSWSGTLVLHTTLRAKPYRIPVHSEDESGQVELGTSQQPFGDTLEDVYRWLWMHEVRGLREGKKEALTYEKQREYAIAIMSVEGPEKTFTEALNELRHEGRPLTEQERQEVANTYGSLESHLVLKNAGLL